MNNQTSNARLSDRELLEKFRRGERITPEDCEYCLFSPEKHAAAGNTCGGLHNWRNIVCTTDADGDDRDIVECSSCGEQREVACNFDEDFA